MQSDVQDVSLAAITSQGVEDSAITIEPGDCIDGNGRTSSDEEAITIAP